AVAVGINKALVAQCRSEDCNATIGWSRVLIAPLDHARAIFIRLTRTVDDPSRCSKTHCGAFWYRVIESVSHSNYYINLISRDLAWHIVFRGCQRHAVLIRYAC